MQQIEIATQTDSFDIKYPIQFESMLEIVTPSIFILQKRSSGYLKPEISGNL